MLTAASDKQGVLLLGTGYMASEYVRVLVHLGVERRNIHVVGRTRASCKDFEERFGVSCNPGEIHALSMVGTCEAAIVAVSHMQLYEVTLALLKNGCRHILLEKPGALYDAHLKELMEVAERGKARIFIAFNRRFYHSVSVVRNIIEQDKGLLSCNFDFTEVEQQVLIEKRSKNLPDEVLHRWGVVNSQHVVDLFLHLAGLPREWTYRQRGTLSWHPRAAQFCGSGITEKGVFFSYLSTWNGAGRWGVEFTTAQRKLILRPLEALLCQYKGRFEVEEVGLPAEPEGLKPGLLGQVKAFLACSNGSAPDPRLCSIAQAFLHFKVAEKIIGYD